MKLKLILTTAIAAAGVGGLLADQAAALPSACSQSGPTVTCTYTSGSNPFAVPAGVFSIHVLAVGGSGGSSFFGGVGSDGGDGAVVSGDLPVKAGSTLYALVGAAGVDSRLGGGGGASSDVRTSQNDLSTRLLVAGGGGGAGGLGVDAFEDRVFVEPGGAGGGGGGNDGIGGGPFGGGGGSTSGGAGGAGSSSCFNFGFFGVCGTGESGSAGGSGVGGGGGGGARFGLSGIVIAGGNGGEGGGGWFGGGGGGGGGLAPDGGGGGGGGSNLVPPGGSQSVDTTRVPLVTISYQALPTTKEQCKNGGWRNFPQFKNQGLCIAFVNHG